MIEFNGVFFFLPLLWFIWNVGISHQMRKLFQMYEVEDELIRKKIKSVGTEKKKKNCRQLMATTVAEKWCQCARSIAIACPVSATQITRPIYLYTCAMESRIYIYPPSEENWSRHLTGGFCSYVSMINFNFSIAISHNYQHDQRPAYGSMYGVFFFFSNEFHSARGNRLFRNLKSKAIWSNCSIESQNRIEHSWLVHTCKRSHCAARATDARVSTH